MKLPSLWKNERIERNITEKQMKKEIFWKKEERNEDEVTSTSPCMFLAITRGPLLHQSFRSCLWSSFIVYNNMTCSGGSFQIVLVVCKNHPPRAPCLFYSCCTTSYLPRLTPKQREMHKKTFRAPNCTRAAVGWTPLMIGDPVGMGGKPPSLQLMERARQYFAGSGIHIFFRVQVC